MELLYWGVEDLGFEVVQLCIELMIVWDEYCCQCFYQV